MNLEQKANQFAKAIMNTNEFMELKEARSILDNREDLRVQIKDFVKKYVELHASNTTENLHSAIKELEAQHADLPMNPEVSRYLEAEKKFREMMHSANKVVTDTIQARLK